jgi:hypothetical protein
MSLLLYVRIIGAAIISIVACTIYVIQGQGIEDIVS